MSDILREIITVDRAAVRAYAGGDRTADLGHKFIKRLKAEQRAQVSMTTQIRHGNTEHICSVASDKDATGEVVYTHSSKDEAMLHAGVLWLMVEGKLDVLTQV